MKKQFLVASFLMALISVSLAQQQPTEEQCRKDVEASISAIELTAQLKATEKKLKDLSVNDIREIQRARGNCVAMQDINKRTMN